MLRVSVAGVPLVDLHSHSWMKIWKGKQNRYPWLVAVCYGKVTNYAHGVLRSRLTGFKATIFRGDEVLR